jgi:hypothetical protein
MRGADDKQVASLKRFRRQDEQQEDREPPDDPGNPTVT